jgi:hypothetical protein
MKALRQGARSGTFWWQLRRSISWHTGMHAKLHMAMPLPSGTGRAGAGSGKRESESDAATSTRSTSNKQPRRLPLG